MFTNLETELVFQDGSTVVIDGGNGGTSPGPDGDGGVVYFDEREPEGLADSVR